MPKNSNRTILVTGATGKQGGAALRHLRERGFPIRALTRDPNQAKARELVGRGTEVFRGDLDDAASLTRALDGVYGVYSVQAFTPGDEETEIRQGTRLIDAARGSRISHFVYSSVGAADQNTGIPHFESKARIEQHLRTSGLHFTIFRPVFFMENWLGMRPQIEQGALALPLGPETRLQMIAVDDIGAFVALAFEKTGHFQDQARELAGDELSMAEIAERFARTSGREVAYRQVPWDEWQQKAGRELTIMWRWFEEHGYHVDTAQVRQEYPQLTGFDRWLSQNWSRRQAA
jgi:uncharacterized protein YbjT (DUF2867 family)